MNRKQQSDGAVQVSVELGALTRKWQCGSAPWLPPW